MMSDEKHTLQTIMVVLLGFIPAMLQFYSARDIPALIILGFSVIFGALYFIYDGVQNRLEVIERRLLMLEGKGTIDPRNVILAIMIILFVLYLRVTGFI
ncbi:MAG: hypothetical protein HY366_00535 [Candidatus Aenigmarchaeota archaeon]|nr:hypothetical protein [Candidatus Aenigmarchaeota archaeon]